jgi:glycosyltransferase involved in cell wall biosynthesis
LTENRRGRILLVCAQCDGDDTGESWCGYKWASELSKHYDVTLLTVLFPGDRPPSLQVPQAHVIEWKAFPFISRMPRFNRAIKPWYPNFYRLARKWLKENATAGKFDLVHHLTPMAMRYPSPCAGLGLRYVMGPVAGTLSTPKAFIDELDTQPTFMKLRGIDDFRLRYDPMLRKTYEDAQAVICTAPYAAERLSAFKLKRVVIETEVVIESAPVFIQRAAKQTGKLNLLFVGRVVRTKGLRDAIRALALLEDLPDITLTVAGAGEDMDACKAECASLGLVERVNFLGLKTRSEIDALYQHADVFLFPSFREATGIVLFEAMGAGLPVITADYGGPTNIITTETGILVPVKTPKQFVVDISIAIRSLASNPILRSRMSAAAVKRCAELGLWENKMARIATLYHDLANISPDVKPLL